MPIDKAIGTKVLVTVKTYPHPSERYNELVCTAGITDSGEWVRLYPVDYRYRPMDQWYQKYQWIDVVLEPAGAGNDNRAESRRPDLSTLRILGSPLPAGDWSERRRVVDAMPEFTVNQLVARHDEDKMAGRKPISLGLVRPTRVLDVLVVATEREWKPAWRQKLNQGVLFGDAPKVIRKVPYMWKYVFDCADSRGKPHTAMNEDWEIGMLYWKELERLGSEDRAAESVRQKCVSMAGPDRDTRFFMGTRFPYNTWLVLGVFWPPRENQPRLF